MAAWLAMHSAQAQDTVCARVKIGIKQELTRERHAFEAEMKINNTCSPQKSHAPTQSSLRVG
jgi:hypothetical protein